jgi:hypothetical protein
MSEWKKIFLKSAYFRFWNYIFVLGITIRHIGGKQIHPSEYIVPIAEFIVLDRGI